MLSPVRPPLNNPSATRPGQLTLSNVINDASRAVGTQGDGLSNDGSTGIWPAAANLCTNGGFETDTTGWVGPGGGETLARSTAQHKFGSASLFTAYSGAGTWRGPGFDVTISLNTTYVMSGWVYFPTNYDGGGSITFTVANFADTPTVTPIIAPNFALKDQWQRVVSTVLTGASDTTGQFCYVREGGAAPTSGRGFYVDGMQYETGSVATPYIETDGGTASRSAARVQMPVTPDMASVNQFWFAGRVRVNQITSNGYLAYWPAATGGIGIVYNTLPKVYVERHQGGFQNVVINGALTVGDYITLIGYGTPSTIGISYNGGAFTTTANALPPITPATSLDLGQTGSGSAFGCFDYLWFAVGNGLLNNASSAAIHAFGNTDPTIRSLDQVARGAHAMAVWSGRDGTFQRRIGA